MTKKKKKPRYVEISLPTFPGVIRPLSSASFIILYPILHAKSWIQMHVWTKDCQWNTIACKSLYINQNTTEKKKVK